MQEEQRKVDQELDKVLKKRTTTSLHISSEFCLKGNRRAGPISSDFFILWNIVMYFDV
jgi:hypothetical protein